MQTEEIQNDTFNIYHFPHYQEYAQKVIDWNYAAGNHDVSQEAIETQIKICRSELQETLDGIEDYDDIEIIDGIIDSFVTVSFLLHMKYGPHVNNGNSYSYRFPEDSLTIEKLERLVSELHSNLEKASMSTVNIEYMLSYLVKEYGMEKTLEWMNVVIDSNNSKFIPLAHYEANKEEHHKYVEEKYAGEFENIVALNVHLGNDPVVVFRADNGKGKILKPYTMTKPVFAFD